MNKASTNQSLDQLITVFNNVMADTEELLNSTADQGGEKISEIRSHVTRSLNLAKDHVVTLQKSLIDNSEIAVKATDDYVHEHPWTAVGFATTVGVGIGLLISRR